MTVIWCAGASLPHLARVANATRMSVSSRLPLPSTNTARYEASPQQHAPPTLPAVAIKT